MSELHFHQVSKVFDDGTRAVSDFDLHCGDGEFVVLVGPSGCGKSTLLRMVAGLEEITSGEIRIGDLVVNGIAPQARNVAMVFQNYALYPHMTVRKNLAFPLKMNGLDRTKREERVGKIAKLLGLEPLLDRRPRQLSGGQRQRVAMGRALVREPVVFLMDEPLSNLDAKLRVQMRSEVTALQKRLGTTTLYVTHDQVEAMTMGDRLAVLHQGRLQQVGTPEEIYQHPANVFVATFIGSPAMSLLWTTLHRDANGAVSINLGKHQIPLPTQMAESLSDLKTDQRLLCGLRPEAFTCCTEPAQQPCIRAQIESVELLGHEQIIHFRTDVAALDQEAIEGVVAGTMLTSAQRDSASETPATLVARLGTDERLKQDEVIQLAVKSESVALFTPDGNAVCRPTK